MSKAGSPKDYGSVILDKSADEAVRLSFDYAPVGLVLSEERIIKSCNDTFCQMVGYDKHALLNQSFAMFYANTKEFQQVRNIGLEPLKRMGFYTDERMIRRSDGKFIWCRFRAHTLTPNHPLRRIILSYASIPERLPDTSLTMRERQVTAFLANGMTSKLIARKLQISPRTVEDVRGRLLRKFKVKNTAELLSLLLDVDGRG